MHLFHHPGPDDLVVLRLLIPTGVKAEPLRAHDLLGAGV